MKNMFNTTEKAQKIEKSMQEYGQKYLDNACFTGFVAYCHDVIPSTNSLAKELFNTLPSTSVITAEGQTAGRGRMGRNFYSPSNTGAYFSVVIKGNFTFDTAMAFTPLTAVAVCKAIENITSLRPKIKWVNDVYLNDKKVCGVLTESIVDEKGLSGVIIGVGVNLQTQDFPTDVIATSLFYKGLECHELIGAITAEILKETPYIAQYRYIDEYRKRDLLYGESIKYIQNGSELLGVCKGISSTAGLIVEGQDGKTTILTSGEVTVRKA